jgi:hypothetical protein
MSLPKGALADLDEPGGNKAQPASARGSGSGGSCPAAPRGMMPGSAYCRRQLLANAGIAVSAVGANRTRQEGGNNAIDAKRTLTIGSHFALRSSSSTGAEVAPVWYELIIGMIVYFCWLH